MRLRKKRRNHTSGWKVLRRCIMLFSAVGVIPLLLVIFVTTDNYMRPVRRISFSIRRPGVGVPDLLHGGDSAAGESVRNATAVARRLEARRRLLRRRCSALGLDKPGDDSLHKPNPWEFLVSERHHLVWCNVFKAASTSWMYNFNLLAGYSPSFLQKSKQVPMSLARQRYPRPSLESLKKALNTSVSFIIVRHPLERLLSAYRDKLQHALPHTHHRKLGVEIVKKYRKTKKGEHNGLSLQRWPTFSEFVEYLVDTVKKGEPLDMHWTPIVEFCTPCMFDFKVIAHTETLQKDQEYLIKKAGLEKLIKPQWLNAGRGTTVPQLEKYYSQLTRSQILQLYHIYRFDFELFNYSLTGYLELGKPDDDPSSILAAITMKDTRLDSVPQIY